MKNRRIFGEVSLVPFSFISHWRWFGISSRGWQGYTLHLFEFGISNHGASNCVIYVRRPNAGLWLGAWWRVQFGCVCVVFCRRTGGVNGRFIYHRCHSPPERKSALPNWNIAEFTLLIRALSPPCAQPKAIIKLRTAARWHLIASGLMWARTDSEASSAPLQRARIWGKVSSFYIKHSSSSSRQPADLCACVKE